MTDIRILKVSAAEVLRFFFFCQQQAGCSDDRKPYAEWLAIGHDDEFCNAVRDGWPLDDDNSVVGWTVGTDGFNESRRVRQWIKTDVEVNTVYSKRVDSGIDQKLKAVMGNLKDLAEVLRADIECAASHRFQLDREPSEDFYMIGVAHESPTHFGTIELLDGSHRVVAMAAQEKTTVKAYIAEIG